MQRIGGSRQVALGADVLEQRFRVELWGTCVRSFRQVFVGDQGPASGSL
jgi:hypothetical protein